MLIVRHESGSLEFPLSNVMLSRIYFVKVELGFFGNSSAEVEVHKSSSAHCHFAYEILSPQQWSCAAVTAHSGLLTAAPQAVSICSDPMSLKLHRHRPLLRCRTTSTSQSQHANHSQASTHNHEAKVALSNDSLLLPPLCHSLQRQASTTAAIHDVTLHSDRAHPGSSSGAP